ncbi:MAG: phenylalanine--tRNA ligase subunit beta [Sediminibacterium sp.]
MTISYNWLSEYLPDTIEPEKLSRILTSIGLEVESLEKYERIKGGLAGLVIGEVLECSMHPNADKLTLTKVNIGLAEPLQIVCGAPNVAVGQKVVVAGVGTTIYPLTGNPITMKIAKIRGIESFGMICAEDEIGLGGSHAGILVMPASLIPGTPAAEHFQPYSDWIYEIGLTPNRMDAMSHFGVARDVCAYLSHHQQETRVKTPNANGFKIDNNSLPISVQVENSTACPRYAGLTISGVTVKESPDWLKNKLLAIGLRPINNIVDITNFILHETGQPLHAFDTNAIEGKTVIVKNLDNETPFITLDGKERKLTDNDLMICNATAGMCIAGVYGGQNSGVVAETTSIFLESAWFQPSSIRKSSVHHGLRTDAATRFEKGVDIDNTVIALKRAALLIKELAGGEITSEVVDIYPNPLPKTEISLKHHYLKKLSGKNYHADKVNRILSALGFEILKEGQDELRVAVPRSKPDISLPADIVEEIIRIDGLDNIEIPSTITISPAIDPTAVKENLKEKIANYLVGQGFVELLTNSITNSKYFSETVLETAVKMINSLSADLDILRPSMLETGLETLAYNLNRKNNNLQCFEFGKTYFSKAPGQYSESEKLALYFTGENQEENWHQKSKPLDIYKAKGVAAAIIQLTGLTGWQFGLVEDKANAMSIKVGKKEIGQLFEVSKEQLAGFDIKQAVYYIDIDFGLLLQLVEQRKITYKEVPKFPAMLRDLALVVNRSVSFEAIEQQVKKTQLQKLQQVRLFDVFESEKLGLDKKSMAVSFTFMDDEKTLTDKEVDAMVAKLVHNFEKELGAEIRK